MKPCDGKEPKPLKSRLRLIGVPLIAIAAVVSLLSRPKSETGLQRALLAGARVDGRVLSIINRSCRDCHSEQTSHPWYSYVAPISWIVQRDVQQGREHLNFSSWPEYSIVRRERALSEIANQVADGDMPLRLYTLVHPSAKLTEWDVSAVFAWTQSEKSRLILENNKVTR